MLKRHDDIGHHRRGEVEPLERGANWTCVSSSLKRMASPFCHRGNTAKLDCLVVMVQTGGHDCSSPWTRRHRHDHVTDATQHANATRAARHGPHNGRSRREDTEDTTRPRRGAAWRHTPARHAACGARHARFRCDATCATQHDTRLGFAHLGVELLSELTRVQEALTRKKRRV